MDDALPPGYLDPYDAVAVADLVTRLQAAAGTEGVIDLLRRLPGASTVPGRRGGLFRATTPDSLRLGSEYAVAAGGPGGAPPVLEHVVSGVVLQREPLLPGRVAGVLPRVVADLARELGARTEVSVVLTAVAETLPAT